MVIIFVRISVRPEKRKELMQTLHSIVEQVRKESACLHSGFYQDVDNEEDFLVVEEWATQVDSDNHLRSDIFTVLMGAGCLMRRSPEIMIHTVSHSKELEA
ncbi:MAG: antibiotic biosynthesis monooxygenase [Gammaproteobacteria bacterium]|jgi:quinol monooxygenase YgiN